MKRLLFLAGLTLYIFFFLNLEVLFAELLIDLFYVFIFSIGFLIFFLIFDYLFDWLWSLATVTTFSPAPPNYSAELTEEIIRRFKAGETLEAIASDTGKTLRSLRGKLVSEGIYSQYKDINLRLSQMTNKDLEPLLLSNGAEYPLEDVAQYLMDAGYMRVSQVTEEGCYSITGGTIHVFPFGGEGPVLLDYFGDTIETIKANNRKTALSSISIPPLLCH